eukprot:6105565-Amphidinium_carterae.3
MMHKRRKWGQEPPGGNGTNITVVPNEWDVLLTRFPSKKIEVVRSSKRRVGIKAKLGDLKGRDGHGQCVG